MTTTSLTDAPLTTDTRKAIRVSASQVGMFRGCQRKWAHKFVDRLPYPQTKKAALGDEIHAQLERWLKHGVSPDLARLAGRVALAGVKHLPSPSASISAERRFAVVVRVEGVDVELVGKVDAEWEAVVDIEGAVDLFVQVDHKSRGDLDHAMTVDELIDDPQRTMYAFAAIRERRARRVHSRWLYLQTSKPHKALPIDYAEDATAIEERMGTLLGGTIRLMVLAHREPSTSRPQNFDNCDEYGACPYLKLCNPTPTQRLRGIVAASRILEMLENKAKGNTPSAGTPPPPAQTTPPSAPPPATTAGTNGAPTSSSNGAPAQQSLNPPEKDEPEQVEPEPVKRPRGRPTGSTTSSKKAEVTSDLVDRLAHAAMSCAGILSGRDPKLVTEHYEAWRAGGGS